MKKWYNLIDFYRLTGITLIWISAWLFMIPSKASITAPVYNNIWRQLLSAVGISHDQTVEVQQLPDLISGFSALIVISILQFRGILSIIFSLSESEKKQHRLLFTVANLTSIVVHTLFFTILIKIFVFPSNGNSSIIQSLKSNIVLTIFTSIAVSGMIFGAQSISKIIMLLYAFVIMFKNINFVSSALGLWGFIAILLAVCGFYLEFCHDSFSRKNLILDLNFFLGKYEALQLQSLEEQKNFLP